MTMTRLKISKTLLAVMLTSAVATGSAYAENNAQTTNESAGQKVDSSMNKVGNFMDDSAITAKVCHQFINGYGLGVKHGSGHNGIKTCQQYK